MKDSGMKIDECNENPEENHTPENRVKSAVTPSAQAGVSAYCSFFPENRRKITKIDSFLLN